MDVLDKVKTALTAKYSDWIKVVDDKSPYMVSQYPYGTGVVKGTTENHCVPCVTVNHCWFKNEPDKKPKPISDEVTYQSIKNDVGLYHPNCHCQEIAINTPLPEQITFEALSGKFNYFFIDKMDWYKAWGYDDKDMEQFKELIVSLVQVAFCKGDYEIEKHDKYGVSINIFISVPGVGEKAGKFYDTWSCYKIFPNGRLKANTIIGGK